jgi:hypothetical protein
MAWKSSIARTCTAQDSAAACLSRVGLRSAPARHRPARRQVAVDQVVRRGLVGHQVGSDATGPGALDELRQDLRRIAEQTDRDRLALGGVFLDQAHRVVEILRLFVQIARAQPEVDAALLALDVQRHRAGERGGQRLGTAHASQAGGEDPAAFHAAAEMLAPRLGEGLVGALHDALGADVDPRASSHLAIHEQTLAVELVEVLPGRPLGHEVRVRRHAS